MIFCTNTRKFGLSGIAVLVFYLISIILTPLFHKHPGEHHPGSTNTRYHSHTEPFTTHTSEHSDEDHREDATPGHFSEPITASDEMVGVSQAPGNIINSAKLASIVDIFIPKSSERCQSQVSQQNTLSLLSPQPQQDYCILTATNLSPPQA